MYYRSYRIWLILILSIVNLMVVLGGYTRLTDSGLSITEWNLWSGILPPFSLENWQILFAKYQEIPQFKEQNFHFSLADFQRIFWLEYIHRLVGRILGVVFILGGGYFVIKNKEKIKFIILCFFLLMSQGLMGWLMVYSGLSENISVSHFRLACHLLLAFVLFAVVFREFMMERKPLQKSKIFTSPQKGVFSKVFFSLLALQVIYGAFVAGKDAGLIYNEFPFMGEGVYPAEIFNKESFFRKIFYQEAILQFLHRVIATILLLLGVFIYYKDKAFKWVFSLLLVQYLLGIITILTFVHIHIAILHQFVALWLFALSFNYVIQKRV